MNKSKIKEDKNEERNFSILVRFLGACVFCYLISWTSLLFRPRSSYSIESFDRIIGMGVVNDSDITQLVSHFYLFLFILFISVFIFSKIKIYVLSFFRAKNISELWTLSILFVLGILNNILYIFVVYLNSSQIKISANILLILILFYLISFSLRVEKYVADKIVLICLTLSSLFFILTGVRFLLILAINLSFLTCYFYFFSNGKKFLKKINIQLLAFSSLPLLLFGFVEALHVLPQHGLFLTRPLVIFCFLSTLTVFIGWLADKYWPLKKETVFGSSLLLLIGFALISCQQGFYINVNADIFETANSSVLISDFLNHGVIPIVGHYGGHMLSGVLEGVGYALLTGDYYGAIFSPYSGYMLWPIWTICFFVLMKIVLKDVIGAFISTLCFPFISSSAIFFLGLLVCFATIDFLKRVNKSSVFLLWTSWIFCALYRLDLGFAFIVGSAGTIILICFRRRELSPLKLLLLSGIPIFSLGILVWLLACFYECVDPILRLKEFIAISASNRNWAYGFVGNPQIMAYSWCYLIIPALVCCSLSWLIINNKIAKKDGRTGIIILLLVLGFSYIANFTRGLVRHNLVEMAIPYITWTAYLYLAIFVSVAAKKRILVLPTLLFFFVVNGLLISNSAFSSPSLLQAYISNSFNLTNSWRKNEPNGEDFWSNLKKGRHRVERIEINQQLLRTITEFDSFLKEYLRPDETYLDFMNKSFLYSATNRLNPVYVAQSPIHLSGEFSQEMYLKEIERKIDKVPFAIFSQDNGAIGTKLDGVDHVIRYYKIAEYIYQKFCPLLTFGNYAVWVQKKRYEEYRNKLQKGIISDEGQDISTKDLVNHSECLNATCTIFNENLLLVATNSDPQLDGIQKSFNLKKFLGRYITIDLEYDSSVDGDIQLFFTDGKATNFSEENSIRVRAAMRGSVIFNIPFKITESTKLRLDPPPNSNFLIKKLTIKETPVIGGLQPIGYGYDLSNPLFHDYRVGHLSQLWGEYDEKKAKWNKIIASLERQEGIYKIPLISDRDKQDGNYLLIEIDAEKTSPADGADVEFYNKDMEKLYTFKFTIKEGFRSYLFRISSDYYWYASQPVFLKIKSPVKIKVDKVNLLQGD